MKNITLSADERTISKARERAQREHTTLNQRFRDWLAKYADSKDLGTDYLEFMKEASSVNAGRHFTRDEMNER